MTELARELVQLGVDVHYVAEEALSDERRAMGWVTGDLAGANLHYIATPEAARTLVESFPAHTVHITQGVRANGLVADAQRRIIDIGHRHYPIMEKVDLRGLVGKIKPFVYMARLRAISRRVTGILCIGEGTDAWVMKHAPRGLDVIPFVYFLRGKVESDAPRAQGPFRFVYVGSLIQRKRVDLLIQALELLLQRPFELEIVGDGPLRAQLEHMAKEKLFGRVTFRGTLPMDQAIKQIKAADCLVLPSDKDGFGAVVSEAQINGTPAICSSECGAAATVRASGAGGVFAAGDVASLKQVLGEMLDHGSLHDAQREALSDWARCLTAEVGADYLLDIVNRGLGDVVQPPWERESR